MTERSEEEEDTFPQFAVHLFVIVTSSFNHVWTFVDVDVDAWCSDEDDGSMSCDA